MAQQSMEQDIKNDDLIELGLNLTLTLKVKLLNFPTFGHTSNFVIYGLDL
jgi:hypothetical protein